MSFKDADKRLLAWYERELSKAGVEIRLNTPVEDPAALIGDFDEVIVCTGSRPKTLPIPGFEKTIDFTQLLLGDGAGDTVVFLGGGQSACEAAYELSLQGKHPVIVEMANDLITAPGTCLANSSFLRDALAFRKVPVYLNSTITDIRDGAVTVKGKDGKSFELACDSVVNAVGFEPAPLGEKDKNIRRVGTCVSWGNLRNVIWNAWDVCMKI